MAERTALLKEFADAIVDAIIGQIGEETFGGLGVVINQQEGGVARGGFAFKEYR